MTKVLIIGAAGLDWPGFLRRRAAGVLPALESLRRRGVTGVWPALPSPDEPAAWGCLASGHPPEAHGLWRSTEAFAGGVRPITRASWRTPPLWASLSAAGVPTASVAWPGTRPGAGWAGTHLDEDFSEPSGRGAAEWALPLACGPPEARDSLRDIRVHPTEITADMLKAFVPAMAGIDQAVDAGLPQLALAMAETATIQAGAEWILRQGEAQAVFVRLPWLGRVRKAFERAPPPFDGVTEVAWGFTDGLIAYLADLVGPDWLVLVAAPGWRLRPGLLLAAGAGVAVESEPRTCDMLDLAPTILARFGLHDLGLPGRRIETISPQAGTLQVPDVRLEGPAPADADLLGQALAAGYSPPPPASGAWRARGMAQLSGLLLDRAPARAAAVAASALEHDPGDVQALAVRAIACFQIDQPEPLPGLASALMAAAPQRGWGALAQGAYHVMRREIAAARSWLQKAEADVDIETRLRVAAAWLAANRPSDAARVFNAVLALDAENASAEIGLGVVARMSRDFLGAEQWLLKALRHDPGRPAAHLQLAAIYATTGRPEMAERASAAAIRLGARIEEVTRARCGAAMPPDEG